MIRFTTAEERQQVALEGKPFHCYTGEDGTVWTEFHRLGDNYLLRFPDLADFEVSANGEEVVAHPAEGTDAATIEHLYINQLVPLALSRQGQPTYHASVVTVPGGAVAFIGKSGAGKSTLAASFALAGAAFLRAQPKPTAKAPAKPAAKPAPKKPAAPILTGELRNVARTLNLSVDQQKMIADAVGADKQAYTTSQKEYDQKYTELKQRYDKLSGEADSQMSVSVPFNHINDFKPEAVANNVPELKKLLELRDALRSTKAHFSKSDFSKQLKKVIADDAQRQKLMDELGMSEGGE